MANQPSALAQIDCSGDGRCGIDRCLWLPPGTLPLTYALMPYMSQLVVTRNRLTGALTPFANAMITVDDSLFNTALIDGRLVSGEMCRHTSSSLERFSELVKAVAEHQPADRQANINFV